MFGVPGLIWMIWFSTVPVDLDGEFWFRCWMIDGSNASKAPSKSLRVCVCALGWWLIRSCSGPDEHKGRQEAKAFTRLVFRSVGPCVSSCFEKLLCGKESAVHLSQHCWFVRPLETRQWPADNCHNSCSNCFLLLYSYLHGNHSIEEIH